MKDEQAKALRAPFKPSQIGKLPRGNVQLDYVGHAAVTDRLLQVDPSWSWAPLAHDQDGLPARDKNGGLWISLTVCGISRIGYGDAGTKTGPNAVKEAIGDAIRNAAMRFGVALDLWAKEDLQAGDEPSPSPRPRSAPARTGAATQPKRPTASPQPSGDNTLDLTDADKVITKPQQKRLWTIARQDAGLSDAAVKNIVMAVTGQESTGAIPRHLYDEVISQILGAAA